MYIERWWVGMGLVETAVWYSIVPTMRIDYIERWWVGMGLVETAVWYSIVPTMRIDRTTKRFR
jgi:hypothetical protein